jgi:hypothetical protein
MYLKFLKDVLPLSIKQAQRGTADNYVVCCDHHFWALYAWESFKHTVT